MKSVSVSVISIFLNYNTKIAKNKFRKSWQGTLFWNIKPFPLFGILDPFGNSEDRTFFKDLKCWILFHFRNYESHFTFGIMTLIRWTKQSKAKETFKSKTFVCAWRQHKTKSTKGWCNGLIPPFFCKIVQWKSLIFIIRLAHSVTFIFECKPPPPQKKSCMDKDWYFHETCFFHFWSNVVNLFVWKQCCQFVCMEKNYLNPILRRRGVVLL